MRATILFLIWLALSIIGLSRLTFNVEITELLPSDMPEAVGIRQLYQHFSREDELILTIEGNDRDSVAAAAHSLADRLARRDDLALTVIWHLPFEEQPQLGAELLAWLWLNGPPESLDALAKSLAPEQSPETLATVLDDLTSGFLDESTLLRSYDPLGFTALPGGLRESVGADEQMFTSSDGQFRVIYLEAPAREFANYREIAAWLNAVRAEISSWQVERSSEDSSVTVSLTGEPAFVAEISTAMERDMKGSVIATTLLICALFWLWFRRLKPLLWLTLMLGLIFSATFAIGGLVFGQLSAMSIGFAAILLGLAVDYGVVLFRERHASPGDASGLRRIIGPSIAWAATTTAAVFATLNLASLPGVSELGTLVAIGTVVGAIVMLGLFSSVAANDAGSHPEKPFVIGGMARTSTSPRLALGFTGIALVAAIVTLVTGGLPGLTAGAKPFQLRDSESFSALEKMESQLGDSNDALAALPVVVTANSWEQLAERLDEANTRLGEAKDSGDVRDFLLPTALVPSPLHQVANRERIQSIAAQRDRLIADILDAGFSEEATALTRAITDVWTRQATALEGSTDPWILPESELARWLIGRATSETPPGSTEKKDSSFAAVGQLHPTSLATDAQGHVAWTSAVNGPGIQVTGWELLNPPLQALVAGDFRRVFLPMAGVLFIMLIVVFRNIRDLALSLGTLLFSGLMLLTLSRWLPLVEWNTFNVAAVPILFGTGLDYSIHMIFALRRSGGDLAPVRHGISRALLFCGLSTAFGFGSLAFAASEGLASLGLVCALGIFINMLSAVFLLPHWWRVWHRSEIRA